MSVYLAGFENLTYNGPAIKGGCVTRREHRQYPETRQLAGQKMVTVQGGYGTCFCSHGTILISCWRDRGTNQSATTFESGYRIWFRRHWCSIAVQTWSKPLLSHGTEVCLRAEARIRVWNDKFLSYRQK
jgi:hypothetical protein